jgi:outer membrane receptor protein involved in Fe transport
MKMELSQYRLPMAAVIILTLFLTVGDLFAQPGPGAGQGMAAGSITGSVYDADLNVAIEYANIVLRSLRDSSQVNGTITDKSGRFTLPGVRPGRYFVEVSFIGYRQKTVGDIAVGPGAVRDLGRLALRQSAVAMPGVEATAERPTLEYRIDKKVVDVAKMATAASGTAVDVLENVPSVKVDVEGNLTLRGSGNYTVLVDGKPSPVEGSDALQQIPAGTIDKIELVTNPSAKYDPEGVSGIINVLLKKQYQSGLSGTATLDGGWPQRYGGSLLLSYRLGDLSLFAGGNLRNGKFPGTRKAESWTRSGDTTFWSVTDGEGDRVSKSYGLRAGGDYKFSDHDRTSLNLRYGDHGFGMNQLANYRRWTEPGTDTSREVSSDTSRRGGGFISANLDHQHTFDREGHQLAASLTFNRNDGSDQSVNLLTTETGSLLSGRREEESGPSQQVRAKLDYSLPLGAEDKFEAGYQAGFRSSSNANKVFEYVAAGDSFEYRPEYGLSVDYSDNIHALYAQYAGKLSKLGFQPALRVERADRAIVSDSGTYPFNRWDYFPSLHFSYDLPASQQVMASYTRRIDRPRGWELWPFLSRPDAYTVRRGNPALKPELTDALEAGWQMPLGESRISAEGYYRVTHDVIERIQSVYPSEPRVMLHTAENVGTDYSLGAELLFDLQPVKWWRFNLSGDLYSYRVEGQAAGESFADTSFNWGGRLSNEFRLPTQTRLTIGLHFESPEVEAQGRDAGHFMADAAIRQQFFNRQLSVTLQARDLFGSGGFESTAEGENFYSHSRFTHSAPMFSLNLTWNFNNYRPERRDPEEEPGDTESGGDE